MIPSEFDEASSTGAHPEAQTNWIVLALAGFALVALVLGSIIVGLS